MAGPWEQYQKKPTPTKPWERYQTSSQEETEVPRKKEELVGEITEQELQTIAKKHNLTPSQAKNLESNVGFFGTAIKGKEQGLEEQVPGFLADSVALGLPQKYIIETAETEQEKNALDDLRQLAEERKSGWRTAAEIAGSFAVPGGAITKAAKLGTKAAKALAAGSSAAVPAVEMAAKGKRGEELENIAIGAGLGLGLGIAAPKLMRKAKAASTKAARKAYKELAKKDAKALDTIIEESRKKIEPQIELEKRAIIKGETLSPNEIKDYAASKAAKQASLEADIPLEEIAAAKLRVEKEGFEKFAGKTIEEMKREGSEVAEYDRYVKDRLVDEAIEKHSLRNSAPYIGKLKGYLLSFSDNLPLSKIFDERHGTNFEDIINTISEKNMEYTVAVSDSAEDIAKLIAATKKAKVEESVIYDALNSGNSNGVPEELLEGWKSFFKKERQKARDLGLPIEEVKNYVPHSRLPTVQYLAALKGRTNELEDIYKVNMGRLNAKEFDELSGDEWFTELVNELKLTGGVEEINDFKEFNELYWKVTNNPAMINSKLAIEAFTTKARTGEEIPDFVRNKQVGHLAGKWVQSTFRTAYLQDSVAELRQLAQTAEKLGEDFFHKHMSNMVLDLVGSRQNVFLPGVREATTKLIVKAQVKADEAQDPFVKRLYQGMADAPLHVNTIMRQIYANYLGLNPKSAIQNMTSPVFTMVPDVGYGYGSAKYLQSLGKISKAKTKGIKITLNPAMASMLKRKPGEVITTTNLNVITQNSRMLPVQWNGEMLDALQGGIKASMGSDLPKKALEKYTNMMMYMFEKSETFARTNIYFMGKSIGEDLIKDPQLAMKFVPKVDSPVYQRLLRKSIKEQDLEATQDILIKFFNSNNLYNYDRVTMSEYGRYMGPLFSVFSKWPTSVAGRIISDFERKGAVKGSQRIARTLLLPYLSLALVDHLRKEDSDFEKKIIGGGGLKAWTPLDSVAPLVSGEGILASPALASGKALLDGVFKEKSDLNKAVQDTINTYAPGSGLLRFLGEDIPIYRGKAKPKGPKIEVRLKEIEQLLK